MSEDNIKQRECKICGCIPDVLYTGDECYDCWKFIANYNGALFIRGELYRK